jgi:hypothetical protein
MNFRPHSEAEYPFDEFLKQLSDSQIFRNYEFVELNGRMVEVGADRSPGSHVLRLMDYFHQHYPPDLARNYLVYFQMFCTYIETNIGIFNTGKLAVEGSPNGPSMISKKLLKAIHDVLINASDEEWATVEGPPATRVLEFCASQYKDYDED